MPTEPQELWWCRCCDWVYEAALPSKAVRCPKHHAAKKVDAKTIDKQRYAERSMA